MKKKRQAGIVVALLVLCAAVVHAQIYGTSTGITRQNYMPTEGIIHFERQENLTVLSLQRLDALENKISDFQGQVSALRTIMENQRVDFSTQLQGINRGLEGLRTEITTIKQGLREIPPQLEKPQPIVPPTSLLMLGLANLFLLVVVIVLIFWLKAQYATVKKESHLEEHAQIHLVDYINEAMHRGASMADIRRKLKERGWNDDKIDEAVQEVRSMH